MSYYNRNGKGGYRSRRNYTARPDVRIEYPSRGTTYCTEEYGVYAYGRYGRGSVLCGQQKRQWLASFATLEDAQAAYPQATACCGSGYQAPSLSHLPDDGDY